MAYLIIKTRTNLVAVVVLLIFMVGCVSADKSQNTELAKIILEDNRLDTVFEMAKETI